MSPVDRAADIILATLVRDEFHTQGQANRARHAAQALAAAGELADDTPPSDDDEQVVVRPIGEDFYRCPNTGDWVYKWRDERLVVVPSVDRRLRVAVIDAAKAAYHELPADVILAVDALLAAEADDDVPPLETHAVVGYVGEAPVYGEIG